MTKSEIISWFRIQEMFRFHSFHMYGIIGSAVILGVIQVQIMKKINFKDFKGEIIEFKGLTEGVITILSSRPAVGHKMRSISSGFEPNKPTKP